MAPEDLAGAQDVAALGKRRRRGRAPADRRACLASRAGRLLLTASGVDPIAPLHKAVDSRELESADDQAAMLGWRLDATNNQTDSRHCPGYPLSDNTSTNTRLGVPI